MNRCHGGSESGGLASTCFLSEAADLSPACEDNLLFVCFCMCVAVNQINEHSTEVARVDQEAVQEYTKQHVSVNYRAGIVVYVCSNTRSIWGI